MPTYVYRCRECGREFEHSEKMHESREDAEMPRAAAAAPSARSPAGAGFLFKGEGFYITDYRSEAYRSKHKAETEKAEPTDEAASYGKRRPGSGSGSRQDRGEAGRGEGAPRGIEEEEAMRPRERAPRSSVRSVRGTGLGSRRSRGGAAQRPVAGRLGEPGRARPRSPARAGAAGDRLRAGRRAGPRPRSVGGASVAGPGS